MATLSNGKVTVQVADDRAEHFAIVLGMSIIRDAPEEEVPEVEIPQPRKPRGRPRKAS